MVPSLTLNDGVEIPQLGFGVFQVPPRGDPARGRGGARRRLPPHRHRRRLPQREGRRGGDRRLGHPPRRGLRHDQALERTAGLRLDPGGLREEPRPARDGPRRPLPDPLAGADPGPLRRDLEGVRADPRRGPRSRTIGVSNFRDRGPRAARPGDRDRADGQPGRAAPALPPDRAARLARGARDRDRGLEPARPGRPARRARRSSRSPSATAGRRRRRSCAGTCSSATSSSPSRSPRSGSARTSRSSTSSSATRRWPRSRRSTPASASAPTPRPSSRHRAAAVDRRAMRKRGVLRLVDQEIAEATAWADRNTARRLRRINAVAATAFVLGGSLFALGAALAQAGRRPDLYCSVYLAGGVFFSTGGYATVLQAINGPREVGEDGCVPAPRVALVGERARADRVDERLRPLLRHARLRDQHRRLVHRGPGRRSPRTGWSGRRTSSAACSS